MQLCGLQLLYPDIGDRQLIACKSEIDFAVIRLCGGDELRVDTCIFGTYGDPVALAPDCHFPVKPLSASPGVLYVIIVEKSSPNRV